MITFPLIADSPEQSAAACSLALRFGLLFFAQPPAQCPYLLALTAEHLELRAANMRPLRVDFTHGALAYRQRQGGRELLHRAVGIKKGRRPSIIDATAGLGRDGFMLASAGCDVLLLERSPVIAALLADGLQRAGLSNPRGLWSDALSYLATAQPAPEVVYLDPMYPVGQQRALVKKEMRIFRDIVGDDVDAERLFHQAMQVALRRVVVKRPKSAPWLANVAPGESLCGRSTRFDIYFRG